ncbi:MAG: glycosyltransferase [Lachnospiraceae bacterium]|nr:glycosyltransferase [Lachnospiraceae bacterium]
MKTAVVIVTHNRIELLKECLGCVNSQEIPFSRVIVVNNLSTDGTKEYLDSISDERYKIIHSRENLGGAGGFYVALQEAQKEEFDWILIIDDDAMIEKDYMKLLIQAGDKHPEIPAFCGSVHTQGKIDLSHRRRVGNPLIFSEIPVGEEEYTKGEFLCDTVTFCGLLLRGKTFQIYGLPMKDYFIWCDDTEYCLRMYEDNKHILTIPKAVLNHKTVLSENRGSLLMRIEWRSYYGYRNRYDAAKRHLGGWTPFVIRFEYRVFYFLSLLMCLSLRRNIRTQGRYNVKLLKDVLMDTKYNYIGKRDEYIWK